MSWWSQTLFEQGEPVDKVCLDCGQPTCEGAERCGICSAAIGGIPWNAERNKFLDMQAFSMPHLERLMRREDDDEHLQQVPVDQMRAMAA